jgi:NadR type nicotinamide-nucleotide adenylyltransferase
VTPSEILRVTVTGSESTGKTRLAERLAQFYRTVWSREFSREYASHKGAPLDGSDVEPIARGQMRAQDDALHRAREIAIFDTDLVSTVVYAEHYYGSCPEWVKRVARERLADLYLLCDIDVSWVPDPQRDRPHAREEIQRAFEDTLERFGARFALLQGTWAEREARAVDAIDALRLSS